MPSHDANSQVHLEELALVPARADFNTSLCHLEQLVEDVGPFLRLDLQSRKLDPSREDRGAEFLQPFFDVRAVPGAGAGAKSAQDVRTIHHTIKKKGDMRPRARLTERGATRPR